MKKSILIGFIIAIATTVTLIGCKKDKTSTLQIRLTDAPLAVEEVNVDIRSVKVKFDDDTSNVDGWYSLQTNARVYNLLALQNGVDTILATGNFPQNVVKEIRFELGPNNTVKDNGVVYPLEIPSGGSTGLKIKVNKKLGLTLETLVVDFDAALSVRKEGPGDYKLRPVLKIK
jgi:hypothetical protein